MSAFFTESNLYTGPPLTLEAVRFAEAAIRYRLPEAYVQLLLEKNGGVPRRRCHRTEIANSWAKDPIEIRAILGVGGKWGIDGTNGLSAGYMIQEWEYPNVGVVFCLTPAGGHDAVMLDYRACGPEGEPAVVYIADDRTIVPLARSFEIFVANLAEAVPPKTDS